MSLVDVIVVTWNLPQFAVPCVQSILRDVNGDGMTNVILVNNGEKEHNGYFPKSEHLTILQEEKNLGWEGGLKAGLAQSKAPFVVFMNDDTFVPQASKDWITKLLRHFENPDCAAVGPASNVVMGKQQMFDQDKNVMKVGFLIGFCLMVRRSDLDAAGGVDDTLPGGDDLDLSIRLRRLGKHLICDKEVFVYHHGFKSGERVQGADYNSIESIERTNFALIRKHGLRPWRQLWQVTDGL